MIRCITICRNTAVLLVCFFPQITIELYCITVICVCFFISLLDKKLQAKNAQQKTLFEHTEQIFLQIFLQSNFRSPNPLNQLSPDLVLFYKHPGRRGLDTTLSRRLTLIELWASWKKRACRPLRDAVISTQIYGLMSTGDPRGQINDPKVGFGFLVVAVPKFRSHQILSSSRVEQYICFL